MSAVISDDGKYRFRLEREWIGGNGRVLWVMLNPSTADAMRDDSTLRRCIDFSQQWGFAGLYVGNLYAYRSTDPRALAGVEDPVGRGNDEHLLWMASRSARIVCAWGQRGPVVTRATDVAVMLMGANGPHELQILGLTQSLQPRHPLRLRKTTRTGKWQP